MAKRCNCGCGPGCDCGCGCCGDSLFKRVAAKVKKTKAAVSSAKK